MVHAQMQRIWVKSCKSVAGSTVLVCKLVFRGNPTHDYCLERGQGYGPHNSEGTDKPARLVQISNFEPPAQVPGQVSEPVEEVEGDGEGEEELESEDGGPAQVHGLELRQD